MEKFLQPDFQPIYGVQMAAHSGARLMSYLQLTATVVLHACLQLTYNDAVNYSSPDIIILPGIRSALYLLAAKNRCGCQQVGSRMCSQPLEMWLGAIMDWYITIRAYNRTINGTPNELAMRSIKGQALSARQQPELCNSMCTTK